MDNFQPAMLYTLDIKIIQTPAEVRYDWTPTIYLQHLLMSFLDV